MATFELLPDHLVLLILQHFPNDTILPLTTVSKALYRCSIQQIYRYVYFWRKDDRNPNVPTWSGRHLHMSDECLRRPPLGATRIFYLPLFIQTISNSKFLSSFVVGASLSCPPEQEENALQVMRLLIPTLQELHIKRTLATYNPEAEYLSAVTCLEIQISEGSEIDMETGDLIEIAGKQKIYSLFNLPRLSMLSLSGVRQWNLLMQNSKQNTRGISNITHLSLTNSVPVDQGLVEFLARPKALKSLWYELALSSYFHNFFGPLVPCRAWLSAKEFSSALQSQEQSLEELFVYGDTVGDCTGFEPEETIDLRSFPKLKYIGLPLNFLFISKEEALSRSILTAIPCTSEILPPSLQELQIELPNDYAHEIYFTCEPGYALELAPGELSDFVCEVVRNKITRFPNLSTIVFWQCGTSKLPDTYTLEDEESCKEMVQTCKAAQVQISWVDGSVSPLFSS